MQVARQPRTNRICRRPGGSFKIQTRMPPARAPMKLPNPWQTPVNNKLLTTHCFISCVETHTVEQFFYITGYRKMRQCYTYCSKSTSGSVQILLLGCIIY